MSPWSISIKTVGGQETDRKDSFTVSVSPDDELAALQNQIEDATGLKASQQRLIYRGRLLGGKGTDEEAERNPRIRDVAGLCDGQTIHLVPKPASETSPPTEGEETPQTSSDDNDGSSMSGTGTASLLAALLGLGSGFSEDDDNTASEERPTPRRGQRQRMRTSRINRSRRSVNYRLTSEDIVPPDPGSMEPVRQGLMTLHTMLQPTSGEEGPADEAESNESRPSPLDANRQWYRGQWIDCLDTVNQWLEATIVDIVPAEDILPPRECTRGQRRVAAEPPVDPAVSATDFEGRRRLLLEPCDENDSDEEEGELAGFRQRDNNEGVQLILVHYNGWPHRWDEWLRSDSQRIRPFRTRTRHPSSAPYTSPTPQSVFHAAPTTYIKNEDDETDRLALLPELSRAVSAVNDILASVVSASEASGAGTSSDSAVSPSHLPWLTSEAGQEDEQTQPFTGGDTHLSENSRSREEPPLDHIQLESLAPLLDRLGRTLTDAAPHVAALAQNRSSSIENCSRIDDSEENANSESSARTSTGSGLFSLLSLGDSSRRRVSPNSSNADASDASTPLLSNRDTAEGNTEEDSTDPDHVDFVHGMVNTHRGDGRGGRRGQSDDGASLLGAYLAAASLSSLAGGGGESDDNGDDNGGALGRILRSTGGGGGGGGGGGIDVHIHAIITGPGVGPGAVGLAMLGGGSPTTERTSISGSGTSNAGSTSGSPQPPTAVASDHDDMGLFSDLYSEHPQPTTQHDNQDDDEASESGDNDNPVEVSVDVAAEVDENPVVVRTITASDSMRQIPSVSQRSDRSEGPSEGRSSSSSQRSSSRRGNSFGRILRRAMGRRSSRSDLDRSFGSR